MAEDEQWLNVYHENHPKENALSHVFEKCNKSGG